ncbi:MAG: DUF389 domain-containing protein [Anaerolineaceae bacterium]|nr:DUF389 domain-containing protein [Anaerolineaceae bacterium]
MSFPTSVPLPPEKNPSLPPARRRRRRSSILIEGAGERVEFIHALARRAIPSADFFFFSLLTGVVLALGLYLDSQALIVLAALIAPFMAPVMGLSLATVAGSLRFFAQGIGSLGMGSLLVFAGGALSGWLLPILNRSPLQEAPVHAQFTVPDFLILTLGSALATILMVRKPDHKPLAASIALAYELYLPIGVAGFGMTSGIPGLFTGGLIVFASHLAWAALVGAVVLAFLGLKPINLLGYALAACLTLAGVTAVLTAVGFDFPRLERTALPLVAATRTPSQSVSVSPSPHTEVTPTPSPTVTFTPTNTIVPTRTPTTTSSPEPTPVWARVKPNELGGVIIRAEPSYDGKYVKTIGNDHLVEILPGEVITGSVTWVRVRTTDGVEGWIVRALLLTATPAPNP